MSSKDSLSDKSKLISAFEFEKEGEEELPLPKIPVSKGGPLFEDESEHTSLLYNGKEKHGLVKETLTSTKDPNQINMVLQEYDYDTETKYQEPSTNFCLAVVSSFFCVVVGIFAINHAVQAHYYKEAGLLSLADSHGSKAASLSIVAIIMGLIIIMWVTVIRIMLISDAS